MTTPHALLRETQHASSDMYIFEAVIAILEGSSRPSNHHRAATSQIISICKAEIQSALTRMDESGAALEQTAANK